jgi:hypothetical protein
MRSAVQPSDAIPGLAIGVTVVATASALAMVQLRCHLEANVPCGDWAARGLSWYIVPPLAAGILVWIVAAGLLTRRSGWSPLRAAAALGEGAAPGLGLAAAWTWYGFVGPELHPPQCNTPLLCHDVMSHSLLVWVAPWLLWSLGREWMLWRRVANTRVTSTTEKVPTEEHSQGRSAEG